MLSTKTKVLILGIIILVVIIYLNRSYAHIYSYNEEPNKLSFEIQRRYTLESAANEKSIKYVALGDSLTYGLGASSHKGTFPYILGQKFLTEYKKVEIINLAVSGSVVNDVLSSQLPQAIAENPDFVTILIGTNDVHRFADKQEFKTSLTSLIEQLQKNTGSKILLINIPYLGTKSLILPPHNSIMDLKIKEFNQEIRVAANLNKIGYFDLYNKSKVHFDKDTSFYSSDQFHPSDKGYILWGNLINADYYY